MSNDKYYVYVEDSDRIDFERLENDISKFAISLFNELYPDEEIPKNSVSIGTIYVSKYFCSCQIRFIKNGIIMRCKYIKKDGTFEFEIYKLSQTRKCHRVKENDNDKEYVLFKEKNKGEN